MNGAGPGNDQEAIVLTSQNPVNRVTGLVDLLGGRIGDRHLLEQLRRGHDVVDFRNTKVVSLETHLFFAAM